MSWDYDMAKKLTRMSRQKTGVALLEGTVVRKEPLAVSLYGGEVLSPPLTLRLTEQAAGLTWEVGQTALCAMINKSLIMIDRIE